ncbi:recombination protein NinG [Pseudomonas phage 8P]|nr:recombination protein NinG [Pseudomonas phage 8P]
MKWQRTSDHTESSDTIPVYRVTRFRIEGKPQFRPSYAGEFLGFPVPTAKAAREICERHHSITQEARSASEQEEPAGREATPA